MYRMQRVARFAGHSDVIQFWQRGTDVSVNEFLPFRPRYPAVPDGVPRVFVSRLSSPVARRKPAATPQSTVMRRLMTTTRFGDWERILRNEPGQRRSARPGPTFRATRGNNETGAPEFGPDHSLAFRERGNGIGEASLYETINPI